MLRSHVWCEIARASRGFSPGLIYSFSQGSDSSRSLWITTNHRYCNSFISQDPQYIHGNKSSFILSVMNPSNCSEKQVEMGSTKVQITLNVNKKEKLLPKKMNLSPTEKT